MGRFVIVSCRAVESRRKLRVTLTFEYQFNIHIMLFLLYSSHFNPVKPKEKYIDDGCNVFI